jgi:5-methyltetrahydrofolate--homocysteine methyltransferase
MGLLQKLEETPLLLDGAMGTMLMDAGHGSTRSPILLNLERPEFVADVHRQYFEAGSDVVIANTFGGNPLKLAAEGLEAQLEALNRTGVELTRSVCPPDRFVAGDMGPCGKMLKPLGEVTPEEMQENYFQQAKVLFDAGVDLIAIETMYSLDEALAAVIAVKDTGRIPTLVSITFNQNPKGYFTMMGESVERCAAALEDAGVDIIGANCTLNSKDMVNLTAELRACTSKPIAIQPNAGQPVVRAGLTYYEQSPPEFAADARKIMAAGADMIGGCCGTTPEFIQAVKSEIAESNH